MPNPMKQLSYRLYRLFNRKKIKQEEVERRLHLNKQQMNPETHDFSYNSGERQVATEVERIRQDHVQRYHWASSRIREVLGETALRGGDYFCGNGYGTDILAPFGVVHGIDGSSQAIAVAKEHYSKSGATFESRIFPFSLEPESHDFIISLESVEHVPEPEAFVTELAKAVKPGGLLLLSTPNEANYPYSPATVPHHYRHFTADEVERMVLPLGFALDQVTGQCRAGENPESPSLVSPEEGRFLLFSFRKTQQATHSAS